MLTLDTSKRITARQAMRHEWFLKDDSDLMTHNLEATLAKFKAWNAKRKFKGAVRAVLTTNKIKKLTENLKAGNGAAPNNAV